MRKIKYLVIVFSVFSLVLLGCSNDFGYTNGKLNSPVNNDLEIEGVWTAKEYSVLDKNISTDNEIYLTLKSDIVFRTDSMTIGKNEFSQVDYRLKVVKSNYSISYEAKFKIEDLPIDLEKVYTYSVMYNNNVLGEIIYVKKELSYFYYQGVLYTITYNRQLTEEDKNKTFNKPKEEEYNKPVISQGLYLGLKTERNDEENQRESYRTLWISSKGNELMPIKERKNIVIPRSQGIWVLEPKIYQDSTKKSYYEYFETKPLEYSEDKDSKVIDTSKIKEGSVVEKNINYVSADYIATEVKSNIKDSPSNYYEVLPINNVNLGKGIEIQDLLGEEAKLMYEKAYNNILLQLSQPIKEALMTELSYSNFSMYRNNGKWSLCGKVSLINPSTDSYDFTLNIKLKNNINENDTLVIPWKVLKGEIPLLVDAMTSLDGSMAVIILKNTIEIYKIEDGNLVIDSVRRIQLKEGEKIIMSEWCEGSYVEKWAMPFN